MSPLRRRVAERLVQAQTESASLTTFNEVDMTAVMELRNKYKDSFEKAHGAKLGFMSFFVKACVAAAKMFPGINAEVIGGNIVYKKHYDFGIAVSTPKGLVVPVLRDCDALSFAGIEKGILDLAERARSGKLGLPDLQGGTFSITNGGIYGSMMSTPLLNYPQTGILGMHNIVKRAMVIGDEVKVRPMMYVALSYDHRVVDGKEAVSFLVAVKDRLESPDRMLVDVSVRCGTPPLIGGAPRERLARYHADDAGGACCGGGARRVRTDRLRSARRRRRRRGRSRDETSHRHRLRLQDAYARQHRCRTRQVQEPGIDRRHYRCGPFRQRPRLQPAVDRL